MDRKTRLIAALAVLAAAGFGQRGSAELHLRVVDPSGLPLEADASLYGPAVHVDQAVRTHPTGTVVLRGVPFGTYRLQVARQGFVTETRTVNLQSAIPVEVQITLAVAPVSASVVVQDTDTLLDPSRTGTTYFIGHADIRDRRTTTPGRGVLSMVDEQPGWLLEANGVLHPRGSEYGVQYVLDGIPITENRSPSFAPEIDVEDVQNMNVMTSGYPAEFGRKLSGVIEVATTPDRRDGLHGKLSIVGESFDTESVYAKIQQGWAKSFLAINGEAARTDRYLDPPVEENYTNGGTTDGAAIRFERDLTASDHIRLSLNTRNARFQVPNERLQEQAAQRQDRTSQEYSGAASYTRVLSARWVLDGRLSVRDVSALIWSNDLSTPIIANQDRNFRESYGSASLSGALGRHTFKAGAEASYTAVAERFGFDITAPQYFDQNVPPSFRFHQRAIDREQAFYVQDSIHTARWTLNAGIRWDRYSLLVREQAWSPRLGIAWHSDAHGLVLRASYDRAFQTPAFENILLASSPEALLLGNAAFIPIRPSRGNFYEAGFVKSVFGRARLDAKYYLRRMRNFADDSLLLNTGVTFPIDFDSASIRGTEVKLEIPRWGPLGGFISYSNMLGRARLPAVGGLFLGGDTELLASHQQIAITQDQRNTARAWLRSEIGKRVWAAAATSYGSGLPVDADGLDPAILVSQYGERILSRVNFDRGRIRPTFSLDLSAGIQAWRRDEFIVRIQGDILNVTNRLNVINFAGLFSGTAIAPPRSFAIRANFEF